MTPILAAVAAGLLAPEGASRLFPTPEEVAVQLRRLTTADELRDRESAARWFGRNGKARAVSATLPELERVVRSDAPQQVRGAALVSVAEIATAQGQRLPPIVFDALYDNEEVGVYVGPMILSKHKPLPPYAVEAVARFAGSVSARHREDGLFLLAAYAPNAPETLRLARAAIDDPHGWVRHAGHICVFRLTGKFDDFFRYVMRFQALSTERPELRPDASEDEKREQARWNLSVIGLAVQMMEWTEDRPGDVRDALVKALADKDPKVRWAAAGQVGRLAQALAGTPPPGPTTGKPPEPEFPWLKSPRQPDPKKQWDGMKLIVGAAAVRNGLDELAAKEANEKVRERAVLARKQLAELDAKK
jgi:hypothetical protein